MRDGAVVRARGLGREYRVGEGVVHALREADLDLPRAELVVVHGPSGSGKTTLLNIVGGLDRPTEGRVWVEEAEVSSMSEDELVHFRRRSIGFVFQAFGLIPFLTAAENVEVPLRLHKAEPARRAARVAELLEVVGLGARAKHRPYELSGGEQQRVAIARALANEPELLLADEPTGQLDSENSRTIIELVRDLVETRGVSAVVATHDPLLVELAESAVELRDGRVDSVREGARSRARSG